MATGGAPNASFFGDANNNFVNIGGNIVSGIGLGATGTPSIVSAGGYPYFVQQTAQGDAAITRINPATGVNGNRVTWVRTR